MGNCCDGVDEMLAIVEHEQRLLMIERGYPCLVHDRSDLFVHAEDFADAGTRKRGISERREFDDPGAVGIPFGERTSGLAREARLADATHAGERDEPLR